MERVFRGPDPELRRLALPHFGSFPGAKPVELLGPVLNKASSADLLAMGRALAVFGSDDARDTLIARIAAELERKADPKVLADLEEKFGRQYAHNLLASRSRADIVALLPLVMRGWAGDKPTDQIAGKLLASDDPFVRLAGVRGLTYSSAGYARGYLVKLLENDSDTRVLRAAISAARRMPPDPELQRLIEETAEELRGAEEGPGSRPPDDL